MLIILVLYLRSGNNQKYIYPVIAVLDFFFDNFGKTNRDLKMVAKKVSPMDILYHRKSAEEEDTNKGQNKESFITNSLEFPSRIIVFWFSIGH